ncbi:hypothetical protein [Streptosporangium sp. NPDC023615]|uniref:hypothetical protein n=1 Tax=Streptosporangium sp. NPDC023615 TaxID=3154794 RepID=UPI0034448B61
MEFWKTLLGLVRRRWIGFPLLGLALVAAVVTFALVPVRHVSSTSMVLTTPPAGGTLDPVTPQGRSNPLLQFSDGLRTTAGILILAMNTKAVMAELGVTEDGPTEVTINDGRNDPSMMGILTNGPFVYVRVESGSADTVRTVMTEAQARLRAELTRRQQVLGAPNSTYIGLVEVVPPAPPEADRSGPARAAGGAAFLVVLLGLGTAYAVERRRVFRRRSGDGRAEGSASTVTAPADPGRPVTPEGPAHQGGTAADGTGPGTTTPGGTAPGKAATGKAATGKAASDGAAPGGAARPGGAAGRGDGGGRDDRGRGGDDGGRDGRDDRDRPVVLHPADPAGREKDGPEDGRAMRRRRRRAAARRAGGTRHGRRRR